MVTQEEIIGIATNHTLRPEELSSEQRIGLSLYGEVLVMRQETCEMIMAIHEQNQVGRTINPTVMEVFTRQFPHLSKYTVDLFDEDTLIAALSDTLGALGMVLSKFDAWIHDLGITMVKNTEVVGAVKTD